MNNWTTKLALSNSRALVAFLILAVAVMFLSNDVLDDWSGNSRGNFSGGSLAVVFVMLLTMYVAAGIAGWMVWRVRNLKDIRSALITYAAFWVVHVLWSVVDIGGGSNARVPLDVAMVVVSLLMAALLVRVSPAAVILMSPALFVQLSPSAFAIYLAAKGINL